MLSRTNIIYGIDEAKVRRNKKGDDITNILTLKDIEDNLKILKDYWGENGKGNIIQRKNSTRKA